MRSSAIAFLLGVLVAAATALAEPRTERAPAESRTPAAPSTSIRPSEGDAAASARKRAEAAKARAEAARQRAQESQAAPTEAPSTGERTEIPEAARKRPGVPVPETASPTFGAASVDEVEWEIQGLTPCVSLLPCPGLEGEIAVPQSEFSASNTSVVIHVSEWAGYKALTFGIVDPGPEVMLGLRYKGSGLTQTVQWATAGSDVPLVIGIDNEAAGAWEVGVTVTSGTDDPHEKRFRVRLAPPPKLPGPEVVEDDAGDCVIEQGACGAELRDVAVSGQTFANAVWAASEANGNTPFMVTEGVCGTTGATPTAAVKLTPAGGLCAFKLFTGGLSHSKMRPHCLIASWEASEAYSHGGGLFQVEWIDAPDPWSRQKQWHVRLMGGPTSPTYVPEFGIAWVHLKVPTDAPNLTATDAQGLRDYCFQ